MEVSSAISLLLHWLYYNLNEFQLIVVVARIFFFCSICQTGINEVSWLFSIRTCAGDIFLPLGTL